MLIFSNTVCFKTISAFAEQTIWLVMLGPSLFVMSMCMFATIRCPLHKDDSKTAPSQDYQPPGQHDGQVQFQNVDKQVAYGQPQNQQNTGYMPNNQGHGLDI